jgi:hypothetical protein
MDPSSVRVPDGIEPISAYRAWFYSIEGKTAQLRPLRSPAGRSAKNAWDGAGASWVTASCALHGSPKHEVPSEDCSCGFYSLKDLDEVVASTVPIHFSGARVGRFDQVVLGRILLSGKVIEHESGYRAERARIAELIPFRGSERSVMVLAHRLGVGMGYAVGPASISMEEIHLALAGRSAPPPARAKASPVPLGSATAGILAIVGLVAALIIAVVGGWPPIPLIVVSVGQLGRSADSMAKAYRDLRDRRGGGSNRPRLVPPVPPPPA